VEGPQVWQQSAARNRYFAVTVGGEEAEGRVLVWEELILAADVGKELECWRES
jgi:hypothetical protein